MKKAFTMVELIFVIVIIGILAAVAIPKLAATRDDAYGAKCTHEVQQLLSEITQNYAHKGYGTFSTLVIEEMTNLPVAVVEGDGISSPQASLVSDGITYRCASEDIVEIQGMLSGIEYNLTITDLSPTTPAAVTASELIRKLNSIAAPGGSKTYSL